MIDNVLPAHVSESFLELRPAVHHVSLTVNDAARSAAFYRTFGYIADTAYRATGPDVAAGTGVAGAELVIVMLHRRDGGPRLELIEYRTGGRAGDGHNARTGSAHLCFAVDDVPAALGQLRGAGIEVVSPPHTDRHGTTWVYVRDPDGNAVELVSRDE